jgi:hypothetical protein
VPPPHITTRLRARSGFVLVQRNSILCAASCSLEKSFACSTILVAIGNDPPGSVLSRSIERVVVAVAVRGQAAGGCTGHGDAGCRSGGCGETETRMTASVVRAARTVQRSTTGSSGHRAGGILGWKVGGCVGARPTRRQRTGALHRATASHRPFPSI